MPLKEHIPASPSSGSDSSDEIEERADAYLPSAQKRYCHACLGLVAFTTLAVTVPTCVWGVVDPFASISAGYTVSVLLLQYWMMEWPQCDSRPIGLLLAAALVFTLPTALASFLNWSIRVRIAAFILDVTLAACTYVLTIRGPAYEPEKNAMAKRTVIITGCNSGIGLVTAKTLAKSGATIIFACRTESKAKEAMQEVLEEAATHGVTESQLKFMQLDLSSLSSVRCFAQKFQNECEELHVLVCNAGAFFPTKSVTQDGLDSCLASNHFGHFLLIQLLLPTLLATEKKGGEPRIVSVSSCLAYEQRAFDFSQACKVNDDNKAAFLEDPEYEVFRAYGQSKIAGMMCLRELASRLQEHGSEIPVNAVHPGEIDTNITGSLHPALAYLTKIFKPFVRMMLKSPYQGSIGTVFASTSLEMATSNHMAGEFLMRLEPIRANEAWLNDADCLKCWNVSIALTGAPDAVGA